jgi:hypothetical protein
LIPAAIPQIKPFFVTRPDDPSTLKNSRRLEMESHAEQEAESILKFLRQV